MTNLNSADDLRLAKSSGFYWLIYSNTHDCVLIESTRENKIQKLSSDLIPADILEKIKEAAVSVDVLLLALGAEEKGDG